MNNVSLRFPVYNALESQIEHVVYNFLEDFMSKRNYVVKIKKTDYSNIDKNIGGKPDAMILSDYNPSKLCALIELESTNLVHLGITQLKGYAKKLSAAKRAGQYESDYDNIFLIAYDGAKIWFVEYNLTTQEIKPIITDKSDNNQAKGIDNDEILIKLDECFRKKEAVKIQTFSHQKLIRRSKEIIRGNKDLQAHRVVLLTLQASIMELTGKKSWDIALEQLEYLSENGVSQDEASYIKEELGQLQRKIMYDIPSVKNKVKHLYEEIAIQLYNLFKQTNGDLYAFIYEELAEKHSKKEDGEYYTQRHIIFPVIHAIFQKYLIDSWGLTECSSPSQKIKILCNKKIVDIFVGSGGFTYEYIKMIKQELELNKEKALDRRKLNQILKASIVGLDKNDPIAAKVNIHRIGGSGANIRQVETSINWQESWKYRVKNNERIKLEKKKEENNKMVYPREDAIRNYIPTFKIFTELLVDINKWKKVYNLSDEFEDVKNMDEFEQIINDLEAEENNSYSMYYELQNDEYFNLTEDTVIKLIYNKLNKYSSASINLPSFEFFKERLGTVDLLPTNVPYGPIDDIRIKNAYGSRLESVSLKECIDLLRPSSSFIGYEGKNGKITRDKNGDKEFSDENGGIAAVIIPNGIFERGEEKLINYLLKYCRIKAVIKLPFYTFSPYALVQTYFIVFQKKAPFEYGLNIERDRKNVFFYIADNDGKSNSDKRDETRNLTETRIPIMDRYGKVTRGFVYEYLHDDFASNVEMYPDDKGHYYSKLERAWIYGNTNFVNKEWGQDRYTENWTGSEWIKKEGKKWGFFDLEEVTEVKQVEKKSVELTSIANKINEEVDDFNEFSLEEQKALILDKISEGLFENVEKITNKNSKVVLVPKLENGKNMSIPNKVGLSKFLNNILKNNILESEDNQFKVQEVIDIIKSTIRIKFNNSIKSISDNDGKIEVEYNDIVEKDYVEKLVKNIKENNPKMENEIIKNELLSILKIDLGKKYEDILDLLKCLDEITAINGKVSLFENISTNRLMLLPDYYLVEHGDELTEEKINNILLRLLKLK